VEEKSFLSVKNLAVQYTSDDKIIYAVNNVSFDLEKGQTLGLVGETGAGKTTIAKTILQILPDMSSKICDGEIYLEGTNLLKLSEKEMQKIRGSKISMIFQDPMTVLNPTIRIGDQIAEVILTHNKISNAEAQKRTMDMLEMVGIPAERYGEYPFQFSGGMKQRVIIAIALACNPELLLADEPTTALDVTVQAQVLDMINQLKEKLGTSLILITHDLGVVAEMCDRVCVVYAGEIIESGTREDIFDHPMHPYTIGLFAALPEMSKGAKRLYPIEGLPPDPSDLPKGCSFKPRCPYAAEECGCENIPLVEITPGHFCCCSRIKKEEVPYESGN